VGSLTTAPHESWPNLALRVREVSERGEGRGILFAHWASALLANSLGHYQEAMTAAQRAIKSPELAAAVPRWALVELIEAATRSGRSDIAADALHRLAVDTGASGTDWARGLEARSRALLTAGETAPKPGVPISDDQLTAQESQIARLARDGLSNPEIGARLFLSARTVQYHLKKVFIKLGIESRNQLGRVLAD
jgi:DNA-binding NarL/FixJ family response regulator